LLRFARNDEKIASFLNRSCFTIALLLIAPAQAAHPSNAWSQVAGPTSGPALSIGATTNGCLSGAAALPNDGPGYTVIRLSRRRYYGNPDLIDFIESLGGRAKAAGLPPILIGDMAQPRGGPLPFGHASHQTGLDADIWFTFGARPDPGAAERENPTLPSMLLPGAVSVDPGRFGPRQVALLKLTAADPRVDRIFVNPTIKLALCRGLGGAAQSGRDWLRRLRPWWGHDDHFHVRLRCPESSPDCESQAAIPEGDGCDAALEDWTHHQTPPKSTAPPAPPRKLPPACIEVLNESR
jgi:penicillin-insensitive murein endopeptidase